MGDEMLALRRYQAVHWLETLIGPFGISDQPSEKEFISCLRNGIILCHAINKIQPGSVPKVVEKHLSSESVMWDSQPLPAYQYFENVRNFLVAVGEMKLPAFEASDLERENVEAGSAGRIADCILALKAYHEWKQWSGGNGVYRHVKSPLVVQSSCKNFSRISNSNSIQPCRRLDISATDDKHSLKDSIVKALAEHMVSTKENINDKLLSSLQNRSVDPVTVFSNIFTNCMEEQLQNKFLEDPVTVFSNIFTNCLEEQLQNKFLESKSSFQGTLKEGSGSHVQAASILGERLSVFRNSKCCRACMKKGSCNHWQLLRNQEKDLADIKALFKRTKREFEDLRSQILNDLNQLGSRVEEMSTAALGYHKVVQENRCLYNMVQDLKGNIRVYCRIRPVFNTEARNIIDYIGGDGSLVVVDPSRATKDGRKVFRFNRIYDSRSIQDEVFKDAQPLIRSVMDGYNVCILAYGQAGSGKTYTMFGSSGSPFEGTGINYLAVNELFRIADQRKDIISYNIYVQMVGIWNEEIQDLLAEDAFFTKLEISTPPLNSGLSNQDATLHDASSINDVTKLIANHIVRSTRNDRSGNSHIVLTVHVRGKDTSGNSFCSCLHLVDLAGTSLYENSDDSVERLKDSRRVDKSLCCLENVITALSQKNSHIPYRNSKLTSLLQDAFGGHAKILLFAHVSPEGYDFEETISTLKFTQRISTVELGAACSNKQSSEVKELKEEIENLKNALMKKEAPNKRLRSPIEKPKIVTERTPTSRRLSIEHSCTMKIEKVWIDQTSKTKEPKSPFEKQRVAIAESTPPQSRTMILETSSGMKPGKVKSAGPVKLKDPRFTCEKPMVEHTLPRSRRLSIENPRITRTELALDEAKERKSPYKFTENTPLRSRRLSNGYPGAAKYETIKNVENKKGTKSPCIKAKQGNEKTPNRVRKLSLEGQRYATKNHLQITQSVNVQNALEDSNSRMLESTSSAYQTPKTLEGKKMNEDGLFIACDTGITILRDSQAPNIARSTNGKGSHFRKSLRSIGKFINSSEKRNQHKMEASSKGKNISSDPKSPMTSNKRASRRQSVTGIPPPGPENLRRSSLGGKSTDTRPSQCRNARTPPPARSSTKTSRR